jgi:iron complex outermembrane receptor protein
MTPSVPRNGEPAVTALALALALSVPLAPAFARSGEPKTLAPVIVSATRFASDPAQTPIGASVITADEIREAGINNVNEAVRRIGGVYGRQGLRGTSDFSLDLRGFGANSDQNLVVMVDGVRLSESELSPTMLSSIPIESVERIEIVRGGGSVLYGEGATGGTVHVITKRGVAAGTHGTLAAEAGSFRHREGRATLRHRWDHFSVDANLGTLRADNYRDNNDVRQNNFSGGMQWALDGGRIGFRVDAARQDSRFAGALTHAQVQQNPRQTNTPNDFGSLDTNRYTAFAERRFGKLELAAELSHRDRESVSSFDFGGAPFNSRVDGGMTQFSPRLRYLADVAGSENELVAGFDFTRWNRHTVSDFGGVPASDARARQSSRAIYVRDEIRIGNARIAAGARHEVFDKDFSNPLGFATTAYSRSHSLNAWELQAKYDFTPTLNAFGKAGRSYRVANADENAATPLVNQPLEPQTSQDLELGFSIGDAARKLSARVFRHRLSNEIFYNPLVFANVNLDPTQRQGIEIEGDIRLMSSFLLSASVQHVSAKFREGPNAGNEMVLVPRNTASLRLNWLPGNAHSGYVGVQWTGSQRYGGDFNNACTARMPSFATLDARYAFRSGPWEFAVAGTNLTDREYFTNAFGACQSGIYPDAGRQLKVSVRYDF